MTARPTRRAVMFPNPDSAAARIAEVITRRVALATACLAVLAGCGSSGHPRSVEATAAPTTAAAPAVATVEVESNPKLGSILVAADGMTLYRNTAESGGRIVCTGACATAWPPLLAAGGERPVGGAGATGTLATVARPDGRQQVTYDGIPLYRFAGDHKGGDTNGEGINGVWFAVTPAGTSAMAASTATTAAPTSVAPHSTSAPTTAAPHAATTAAPAATTAPTAPAHTSPPTTASPPTSPPTTAHAPPSTTPCAYPPCY